MQFLLVHAGRALCLPGACAADEEHRELAGVPEEVTFASKPQQAAAGVYSRMSATPQPADRAR
jgi:hypothetical protein